MGKLDRVETEWTAEAFLKTDQHLFGDAWKYELVDGQIVAHAAPAPLHAFIHGNLAGAIKTRLRGKPCRMEIGAGAAPQNQQRATARIPDVLIRCNGLPRVIFEVVSPSELRDWRGCDRKRLDEQDVQGVVEIVELYQSQPSAHLCRKGGDGTWTFDAVSDMDAILQLHSVEIDLPLAEIYEDVDFAESE